MDEQGYVSPEEVRQALRQIYRGDAESNLHEVLLQSLADGLKPVDEQGRWKPSPLPVLLFFVLCALFLYFSIGGRS